MATSLSGWTFPFSWAAAIYNTRDDTRSYTIYNTRFNNEFILYLLVFICIYSIFFFIYFEFFRTYCAFITHFLRISFEFITHFLRISFAFITHFLHIPFAFSHVLHIKKSPIEGPLNMKGIRITKKSLVQRIPYYNGKV